MDSDPDSFKEYLGQLQSPLSHKNLLSNPELDLDEDDLKDFADDLFQELKVQVADRDEILNYPIPKTPEANASPLFNEVEDVPFKLGSFFPKDADKMRLKKWQRFVQALRAKTEADWAGLYVVVERDQWATKLSKDLPDKFLLKVAYSGKPSPAIVEFNSESLSNDYVLQSVNEKKLTLIDDMKAYREMGGQYLDVDPMVQSELCFPILFQGRVVGLIDLEGFYKHQFTSRDLVWCTLVALELAAEFGSNEEKLKKSKLVTHIATAGFASLGTLNLADLFKKIFGG